MSKLKNGEKHMKRHNSGRRTPIAKWDSTMARLDNFLKKQEEEAKAAREAAKKEREKK